MSLRYYYRPAVFTQIDIDILKTKLDFTEHPKLIEITKQEYDLFRELYLYFTMDGDIAYQVWKR